MIFNIGLNKSGTTSLTAAMKILGYSVLKYGYSPPHKLIGDRGILQLMKDNNDSGLKLMDGIDDFDFVSDFLYLGVNNQYIEMLDKQYLGSKFIFTVREMESWINSRRRHVERNRRNPNYDGDWLNHNDEELRNLRKEKEIFVMEYFSGRDCLLVLDICAGDGWEKLCSFLGRDKPSEAFPFLYRNPDGPATDL